MMKRLKWILAVISIPVIIYLVGPDVDGPVLNKSLPHLTSDLQELEQQITQSEQANSQIKPDNQSRIIWYDSAYKKTPYSIVYLHGWSASYKEGDPLHFETAARYGCNLYLPRLDQHGLNQEEPMLTITAESLLESAKEAVAVGKELGDKVILMATSTGGTLALYLADEDPDIAGLILYSPNVDIYDKTSVLLNKPWGLQIARLVTGGDYYQWEQDSTRQKYWTSKYRLEALIQLRELIDLTMTEKTFKSVTKPVFMGYYYKNDTAQDHVVSVPAMLKMYEQLGSRESEKRKVAFSEAAHHVIGSSLTSKDLGSVRNETRKFLEEVVGLKPVIEVKD